MRNKKEVSAKEMIQGGSQRSKCVQDMVEIDQDGDVPYQHERGKLQQSHFRDEYR